MTAPAPIRSLISNPPSNLWLLDERSGTTAVDQMGAHNSTINGTPNLAQWPTRAQSPRRVWDLDGTNDYAQVNVTAGVGSSFSAYLWAYFLDGTARNIFSRTDGAQYTWGFVGAGGGQVAVSVWQSGGATHLGCNSGTNRIPTRQWSMLGFVYLTGSPTLSVYLNGKCVGRVIGGAAGSVGSTQGCAVGRRADAAGTLMLGSLHTAGQARATAYSDRDMQRFYEATRPIRLGGTPRLLRRAA